jgi:hypothetical protein
MFLLERLLAVWRLAIMQYNRMLQFNIMNKNILGGCEQCESKENQTDLNAFATVWLT